MSALQRMAVAVPVTDLRSKPVPPPRGRALEQDPLRESQLLLGEDVRVLRTKGPWAFVEALNQHTFIPGRGWRPYPGWVQLRHLVPSAAAPRWNAMIKKAVAVVRVSDSGRRRPLRLSLGTGVRVIEPSGPDTLRVALAAGLEGDLKRGAVRFIGIHRDDGQTRERILKSARQFLGEPYRWGGKSSARLGTGCGVDCSGLVSLSYNATGAYDFPRNARDQFRRCRRIRRDALKPGDLVFLSAEGEPRRIVHVMIYKGGGKVIEASGKANGVREIALARRFGVPFGSLEDGAAVGARRVYFGTLL